MTVAGRFHQSERVAQAVRPSSPKFRLAHPAVPRSPKGGWGDRDRGGRGENRAACLVYSTPARALGLIFFDFNLSLIQRESRAVECIAGCCLSQYLVGMSNLVSITPKRPARLSQKLREAIRLTVVDGLSIVAACERAGMSRQGFHKAMKRPDVRDHLQEVQRQFVSDADAKRAYLKARAFEVALDLMMNSKNEAIRARMVEFLASDAKVSPVAVHIDARQVQGGYAYKRPGVAEQIEG